MWECKPMFHYSTIHNLQNNAKIHLFDEDFCNEKGITLVSNISTFNSSSSIYNTKNIDLLLKFVCK